MSGRGWSENRRYDVKDDGKHKGAQFDFNPYFAANGEFDRLADFELLAGNGIEDYLNRLFDKNCKPQEINNSGVSQQMGR